MQTHPAKYKYEVHVAAHGPTEWTGLPKPFFINKVLPPNPIDAIVTAEVKSLEKALVLFDDIRNWCEVNDGLNEHGCRITLEEMVDILDSESSISFVPEVEGKDWEMKQNPFVAFSDVHADGIWNRELYESLVTRRYYLPLNYVTRKGAELSVLTLHLLDPSSARQEFELLRRVVASGGFSGTLSLENTLAVAVIGPPVTRAIVIDRPST
jgi:hypothetical protein